MSNTQPFSLLRPNFVTDAQTYATIVSMLLRIAVLVGGASDIEFLLRHGQAASIDISLLDLALQVNDIKKIEALLIYGDRFFNREIRQKALMNTVDSDCEGIVKSLLEPSIGNVDPNFWTPSSTSKLYTPLHSAVLNQSFNIVCLLLRHGANPNAQNSSGTSPLHLVGDSSPHIAQYLIKCGAFIDIQDNDGHSPLHSISDLEIAKKFLGADPNIADCKNGATALHAMLDTGDMELVTWVCKEAGANPTPPCDVPPFEHAFRNGMYPTPLIALGLDPWQRNKDGETIAHSSLTMSHSNEDDYFQSIFLAELLDHDPSLIHARDYSENTPLHIAAAKCSPSVILSLVNKHCADMTAVNRFGFSPLTQAVVFRRDATSIRCVLKLMKDRGLGVDSSTDNHGWTALHHAAFHRNNTAVPILIKHGANCNAVNVLGRRPLHLCGYVFLPWSKLLLVRRP